MKATSECQRLGQAMKHKKKLQGEMYNRIKMADGGLASKLRGRAAQIDAAVDAAVGAPKAEVPMPAPTPVPVPTPAVAKPGVVDKVKETLQKPISENIKSLRSAIGLADGGFLNIDLQPADVLPRLAGVPSLLLRADDAGAGSTRNIEGSGRPITEDAAAMSRREKARLLNEMNDRNTAPARRGEIEERFVGKRRLADGGYINPASVGVVKDALVKRSDRMAAAEQAAVNGQAPQPAQQPAPKPQEPVRTLSLGEAVQKLRQKLGFKHGGKVRGPGGPTDDKIPANLSDGEYVLPADTTAAVGVANLDKLVEETHVPAKVQKRLGYADGGEVWKYKNGSIDLNQRGVAHVGPAGNAQMSGAPRPALPNPNAPAPDAPAPAPAGGEVWKYKNGSIDLNQRGVAGAIHDVTDDFGNRVRPPGAVNNVNVPAAGVSPQAAAYKAQQEALGAAIRPAGAPAPVPAQANPFGLSQPAAEAPAAAQAAAKTGRLGAAVAAVTGAAGTAWNAAKAVPGLAIRAAPAVGAAAAANDIANRGLTPSNAALAAGSALSAVPGGAIAGVPLAFGSAVLPNEPIKAYRPLEPEAPSTDFGPPEISGPGFTRAQTPQTLSATPEPIIPPMRQPAAQTPAAESVSAKTESVPVPQATQDAAKNLGRDSALARMGISVDDLARPAVPDGLRGAIVRGARPDQGAAVNLGDYGGDGQRIFGSASKPGGKIDTFTGAGGGAEQATGYRPAGVDFGIKPGEVEKYRADLDASAQARRDALDAPRMPNFGMSKEHQAALDKVNALTKKAGGSLSRAESRAVHAELQAAQTVLGAYNQQLNSMRDDARTEFNNASAEWRQRLGDRRAKEISDRNFAGSEYTAETNRINAQAGLARTIADAQAAARGERRQTIQDNQQRLQLTTKNAALNMDGDWSPEQRAQIEAGMNEFILSGRRDDKTGKTISFDEMNKADQDKFMGQAKAVAIIDQYRRKAGAFQSTPPQAGGSTYDVGNNAGTGPELWALINQKGFGLIDSIKNGYSIGGVQIPRSAFPRDAQQALDEQLGKKR